MHAPLRPSFQVEWHGLSSLEPMASEWHALAARAIEPNVFYEPAFALAAARVFGADAGAVLVRTTGGRLAGLFPARMPRWRGGPLSMVAGWTHPFGPLGTPLVDRDEPAAVIAAWLSHLSHHPTLPARLLLPLIPEQGRFAEVLNAVLAREERRSAAFGRHERALLAPGAERGGYLERAISGGRRKKLRHQRRRLEDIGPVTLATAGMATTDMADVEAALNDFLMLEAGGWKGQAGTAIVSDPTIRDFVRSAIVSLAAIGQVRIDRLLLNGKAIAATMTLMSGDTGWYWKIAYDESLARFSPGVQLMCDFTERLTAGSHPSRVDSCAAAGHPMIDHVWRERLALSDRLIELRPSTMPFGLSCLTETLRRSAIAAAKTAAKAARDRIRGG
jgi:CelD/BcsL family acetyltransferase involved in cellulose biosynthesis